MEYRTLGSTGIRVSEIGFGAWAIGGAMDVAGFPVGWPNTSDEDSLAAIRRARDLGVNFFDTADIYGHGRSESLLGLVLSRKRSDAVIATKVGNVKTSAGEHLKDFSKQHIFYAIDGSLKRLRTDYVDLYQVHNPTIAELRREEIQEAMEMLQSLGKIRYWGTSVTLPQDGTEIIRQRWGYTLQVLYNILNQAPADELLPLAKEHNFGVIARVPLASGLLTGKFRPDTTFPANDVRQNFLTPRRLEEAIERVDEIRGIVGGAARTLGEASLRFILANDAVSTVIPGARNVRQVEANVAASGQGLAPEIVSRLRERLGSYNFYLRHSIRV
ncbi:MAG TPA: aldo/keto reductase [Thermoanaerobaculia bacterium]|nr:aldo/keto reductase [Thermoanaerobaculia bacterium]